MTNTKWLRRALLGGVALSVMAAGAQADELSDLKAQLEALQSRVNVIETRPAATLPEGTSMLTFARGQGSLAEWGNDGRRSDDQPANRGFTIAVTPTADMPAPVAEVVVYGFVKGDVIYDFEHDFGDSFSVPDLDTSDEDTDHIRLHALQTRFGIKSKVDTAIGQIRTKIEADFFTTGGNSSHLRMRHAYGEWDMTPNWTLLVGQTWQTAALLPIGITTVDFSGPAGPFGYGRVGQVRVTYHDGPLSWAVAIERPTFNSETGMPNFSSYVQYDIAGGHQFIVTGAISDYPKFNEDGLQIGDGVDIGWAVQVGANINLADVAFLTVGAAFGDDEVCTYLAQVVDCSGEAWGVAVGLSFNINDTTSFNVGWGFDRVTDSVGVLDGAEVDVMTVHANILWQPVSQMRLGWEVMWGQIDREDDPYHGTQDAVRAQFGAWFFF